MIGDGERASDGLRTVHHIGVEEGWRVGVTDRRQDEILRIEFGLPRDVPLVTAVHRRLELPSYTFVVHGVALSLDATSYGDGTGRRWYRCEDDSLLELPGEHPAIIHKACAYVGDDGEVWIHVPYPENFALLCSEGRVKRAIAVAVWGTQIRYDGSPVFAERRWHPALGARDFIGGIERSNTPTEIERARRSFKLFDRFNAPKGGRPRAYDDAHEIEFFNDLVKAVHTTVRLGEKVNFTSLARRNLGNWRTVKNAVEDFDYDLEALEAEAVRCTNGLSICRVLARSRAEFKKKRP